MNPWDLAEPARARLDVCRLELLLRYSFLVFSMSV